MNRSKPEQGSHLFFGQKTIDMTVKTPVLQSERPGFSVSATTLNCKMRMTLIALLWGVS